MVAGGYRGDETGRHPGREGRGGALPRLVHVASPASLAARRLLGARAIAWPGVGSLRFDPRSSLDGPPPAPGLRRLEVLLAGICGSDLHALAGDSPTVLWPLSSFPSVPGHEILARVADAGGEGDAARGARVVVDPFVSCRVRGLEPCPECARGQAALCRRAAEAGGGVARGMLVGFNRDLPGGWSEALWAHPSQLHRVPDGLPDAVALLVEPLAVAAHALLQVAWAGSERVLVIGAGTIGLCTIAAMRMLGLPAPLVAARHRHQAAAAAALGAHPVVADPSRWPRLGGAAAIAGWFGQPLWLGGFDVVVDAVSGARTLGQAARAVRSGGTLVRVGDVGTLPGRAEPSAWIPDVRILSPFGYGIEAMPDGSRAHTFDLVLARAGALADPLRALVTHTFALTDYRAALAHATGHGPTRSIKVAFRAGA